MSAGVARRYVDFAIRDMAQKLDSLGATRAEAEVKVFGGGDVLTVVNGSGRPTVGKLNSEAAVRILKDEGFRLSACRLGGDSGVHIQFSTETGEVLVRRLDSARARPESKGRRRTGQSGSAR